MGDITIRRLAGETEARDCAAMMSASEPWLTLGRDFDSSLGVVTDPSREVYIALQGGTLAGFIVLVTTGAFVGYIQSIVVSPALRSRGIGSLLLDFAEEKILARGPNVFLCVSSFNPRARRLYERRGYVLVGELPDYMVRGHSEILLRKTLGPIMGA
jgi:ribosomal-protein-alanine N-acetyltransferase